MEEVRDTQEALHKPSPRADMEIDRSRKEAYGSHGVRVKLRIELQPPRPGTGKTREVENVSLTPGSLTDMRISFSNCRPDLGLARAG